MNETTDTQGSIDLSDIAAEMGISLNTAPSETERGTDAEDSIDISESDTTNDSAESDEDSEIDSDELTTGEDDADGDPDTADETDEDAEDADSEDEEDGEEEPDKRQRGVEKRIAKLTAKAKQAEERATEATATIEQLQAQLAQATAVTLAPTPDSPLANIETPEALEEQVKLARRIEAWAEDNPEGAEIQLANGQKRFLEAEEVRQRLRTAREILRSAPSREQWLAQRPAIINEAKAFYPNLLKPGSEEHGAMSSLLKIVPELKRHPAIELMIGDMIEGQRVRFERAKARQKTSSKSDSDQANAKRKSPAAENLPRTPTTSRAPKVSQDKARVSAAKTRVQKGDTSSDAMTEYIESVILG